MKSYKSKILVLYLILSTLACSKEGDYRLQDPPPLSFEVTFDGLEGTFTNQNTEASDVTWTFGESEEITSGDSVKHTFSGIGSYLITMSATVDGQEYDYHQILRVDKPSSIELDDDSFADWDSVQYEDFNLLGKDKVIGGKVDYDANNVYLFLQFNVTENAGLEDHIFGIYIDSDNSVSTGFTLKGMGVEYGIEGNMYAGDIWPSKVDLDNGDSGWPFVGYEPENPMIIGTIKSEDGVVSMEMGIPRDSYGLDSDTFSFSVAIMNSNWSDVGSLVNSDMEEKIVVKMDKQ